MLRLRVNWPYQRAINHGLDSLIYELIISLPESSEEQIPSALHSIDVRTRGRPRVDILDALTRKNSSY